MNCFICCKILPKEETICQNDNDDEEENLNDFHQIYSEISNNCDNSTTTGLFNKPSVLQISHYLQLPKSHISQQHRTLSTLKFCNECEQIRGKLEELCGFLEITQMKINHYLNLLTDRILQKNENVDHQQSNLSSFQEIFHNKCKLYIKNVAKYSLKYPIHQFFEIQV